MLVLLALLVVAILSPTFHGRTWLFSSGAGWVRVDGLGREIIRRLTLSLRERKYVLAARLMGVPPWTIIFRHILRTCPRC